MINLANKIVEYLDHDRCTAKKKILVLGTEYAAHKRLYPDKLSAKSMAACTPNNAQQKELQQIIDQIKSGKKLDAATQNLIQLINQQMRIVHQRAGSYPTHILLSCTELPLALHGHIPQPTAAYRQQGIQVKFVNSEELFVRQICNHMCSIEHHLSHKPHASKTQLSHFHHHRGQFMNPSQHNKTHPKPLFKPSID